MRKLIVKIQYLYHSIRVMNKIHLGDIVVYQNEDCIVTQGVNNPKWDIMPLNETNWNKEKRDVFRNIHQDNFKLKKSIGRYFRVIKQTYNFYKGYWYLIDTTRKPVFSRISFIVGQN